MIPYDSLFSRNYGIFSPAEQERIRAAHVLIIGCGGIGGFVAVCLARSGVEHFTLVEFDSYEHSNMNRQIACFTDTLGRNKAEVVADEIRRINPQAEARVIPRLLPLEDIDPLIAAVDLVFPAADDFAYSQLCFRKAQQAGKPALYVLPSGLWAYISLVMPGSPPVEEFTGMPVFQTYEEIDAFYRSPEYRQNSTWYVDHAGWQPDYQAAYAQGEKPPAQICPLVWMASSFGVLQALKWLAGREGALSFPRLLWISDRGVRVAHLHRPNLPAFWRLSRKIYWAWVQASGKRRLGSTENDPTVRSGD
ncbi:MAG TPA: ThiF family adenylyltransferase [Anaerolineaceae bacterium]|nr:ThiF family adenylyltransferase [Anaerolineaceae bacterium]HPN53523.1 ThiF family adenylyltransferase [Anaerolineaceae bacterium]